MAKWEINKYVWDKTLSNSVTLNILYKYVLFVNKNTNGYFDKQMGIMTRIHKKKFIEEKSIIWDILPRTRYVIVSLKNESYKLGQVRDLDPQEFVSMQHAYANLSVNRHFYLSFYEKTYTKVSLLLLV
jgi:hypothetical protein